MAAEIWTTAIESELQSVCDNRTWVVVENPLDVKPFVSRFVFKLTLDTDKVIERYKARLVARVKKQVEGVNYQDTFSLVMDYHFPRAFALGVIWGNPSRHGDVPVAYTHHLKKTWGSLSSLLKA